jgi:hypothetical protein
LDVVELFFVVVAAALSTDVEVGHNPSFVHLLADPIYREIRTDAMHGVPISLPPGVSFSFDDTADHKYPLLAKSVNLPGPGSDDKPVGHFVVLLIVKIARPSTSIRALRSRGG